MWFHLCFIGSEHRLTQHSLILLLHPSHAFPCPSLTLDLLVMESLGEWDHFTYLNKRKTNISRLSTLTAHPAARESLSSPRRGGRVEWDLPCQGQLQSDKTTFSAPRLLFVYSSTNTSKHWCQSRLGLGAFPAALSCCSDIHTELGWLKPRRVGLNDIFLYSDQSPHLIH